MHHTMAALMLGLLIVFALSACSSDDSAAATDDGGGPVPVAETVYANRVLDYSPELPAGETIGAGFFDPSRILGSTLDSLDVVSLGDDFAAAGGSITVGFGTADDSERHCIRDEIGADFTVHENPFSFSDSSGSVNFTEAAYVEVSRDGVRFFRFSVTFPTADANLVGKPDSYSNLAGIDVGGNEFDLQDVIVSHGLSPSFLACYVHIVDGGAQVPDYNSSGEFGGMGPSGADIDAVQALAIPLPGISP